MIHKQISEGITIMVVNTKNVPQSPFNQSTKAPEEDAKVVLQQYQLRQVMRIELQCKFYQPKVK